MAYLLKKNSRNNNTYNFLSSTNSLVSQQLQGFSLLLRNVNKVVDKNIFMC